MARVGRTHLVIPDCQVRPGVPTDHMTWIGRYIAAKRPDVIVNLGDFADMHSLSSYDTGHVSAEGARYSHDIKAARAADDKLCKPFENIKGYRPEMHVVLGNHEYRINRHVEANPSLEGALSTDDLGYARHGWKVHPFLEVVKIDDVEFSHYFISGTKGQAVSSPEALLRIRHGSCVMGHVQQVGMAIHKFTQHTAIFAGTCYLHTENYLGPQGQSTKNGIWMLNEVGGGTFDHMYVSLNFLRKNYS